MSASLPGVLPDGARAQTCLGQSAVRTAALYRGAPFSEDTAFIHCRQGSPSWAENARHADPGT